MKPPLRIFIVRPTGAGPRTDPGGYPRLSRPVIHRRSIRSGDRLETAAQAFPGQPAGPIGIGPQQLRKPPF